MGLSTPNNKKVQEGLSELEKLKKKKHWKIAYISRDWAFQSKKT